MGCLGHDVIAWKRGGQRWYNRMGAGVILLLMSIAEFAEVNPIAQIDVEGKTFFYHNDVALGWLGAQEVCVRYNTTLAQVTTDNQWEAISYMTERKSVWIGGRLADLPGWMWLDNSFENSLSGTPHTCTPDKYCGYLLAGRGVFFADDICHHKKRFLCHNTDRENSCHGDVTGCHHIVEYEMTWFDAMNYCRSQFNTHLAILKQYHSDDSRINSDYWIGVRRSQWRWNTGEDIIYSKWYVAEPNKPLTERCLEMRFTKKGFWNDLPCYKKNNFICQLGSGNNTSVRGPGPGPSHKKTKPDADNWTVGLGAAFLVIILTVILAIPLSRRATVRHILEDLDGRRIADRLGRRSHRRAHDNPGNHHWNQGAPG